VARRRAVHARPDRGRPGAGGRAGLRARAGPPRPPARGDRPEPTAGRTSLMNRIEVPGGHIAYAAAGVGAPPVVLLHAGYVDHRMYEREIAHLAQRTSVVAPDARTHGQSSTAMAPFRHCDDLAALVREVGGRQCSSGPAWAPARRSTRRWSTPSWSGGWSSAGPGPTSRSSRTPRHWS